MKNIITTVVGIILMALGLHVTQSYAGMIKYSSDYSSLKEAIDSTSFGEMLFVDKSYTITETIDINKMRIAIIGTKGIIRPFANDSPSVLIRIIDNGTYGNPQDRHVSHVILKNLRFINDHVSDGNGGGNCIEIVNDTAFTATASIKLEDITIQNFEIAIRLDDVWDIYIENCWTSECHIGLECATTPKDNAAGLGQIKVFGGFFKNNNYHIYLGNDFRGAGDVFIFGWGCDGERAGNDTSGAIGIYSANASTIFSFGCQYYDLDYVVKTYNNFMPGITALGNSIISINKYGIYVGDLANEITIVGNTFDGSTSNPDSVALLHVHKQIANNGFLVGANYNSDIADTIAATGLFEYAAKDSLTNNTWVSAFKVATVPADSFPYASDMPKGTVIFDTNNNKLKVSDGTIWREIN